MTGAAALNKHRYITAIARRNVAFGSAASTQIVEALSYQNNTVRLGLNGVGAGFVLNLVMIQYVVISLASWSIAYGET
jgi:hypothetical protein